MAHRPSLVKPLLFCTAASGAAFLGAAAYARRRDRVTSKLRRVKNSLQQDFNKILNSKQEPPDTIWGQAREAWESAGFNRKAVYAIIGANIALYSLGFPDLQGALSKWCTMPLPPKAMQPVITALTSAFVHRDAIQLTVNMAAIKFFGGCMSNVLGGEQFLAFFLTAGMVSLLASYVGGYKLSELGQIRSECSMGASGAAWACIAAVATRYPGDLVALISLPEVPIEAEFLVPVLMSIDSSDALSELLNWHIWDHHRHLGGACFGIVYAMYGHNVWDKRESVLHAVGLANNDKEDFRSLTKLAIAKARKSLSNST